MATAAGTTGWATRLTERNGRVTNALLNSVLYLLMEGLIVGAFATSDLIGGGNGFSGLKAGAPIALIVNTLIMLGRSGLFLTSFITSSSIITGYYVAGKFPATLLGYSLQPLLDGILKSVTPWIQPIAVGIVSTTILSGIFCLTASLLVILFHNYIGWPKEERLAEDHNYWWMPFY